MQPPFIKTRTALIETLSPRPHGTRTRYQQGCRCLPCRVATAAYQRQRVAARQRGESNKLVSAEQVKAHLEKLSSAGVGKLTVSEITGIHHASLGKYKSGSRKFICEKNQRLILAVTEEALTDGKHISSRETRRLIKRLVRMGFTKAEIAKRLGYRAGRLSIARRSCVTARTAMKVEKFFRQLEAA